VSADRACLLLRLAGPLQSWGSTSRHNRRTTSSEPTKSGVVGLLAAAQGRRRTDPVDDLARLELAVRLDAPGQLRRDYHTASRLDGGALPSAMVSAQGRQRPTSPRKDTHVTERFYLEDAVFVVAVTGTAGVLGALAEAVRSPAFPLALGRRSCVPTQPLLLPGPTGPVWAADGWAALSDLPWQAPHLTRERLRRQGSLGPTVTLPVVMDDPAGQEIREDLPLSFDPRGRRYASRRVSHQWVQARTGASGPAPTDQHDPFALLGW
jgi:CRISPR system Cascade subunit CasD